MNTVSQNQLGCTNFVSRMLIRIITPAKAMIARSRDMSLLLCVR